MGAIRLIFGLIWSAVLVVFTPVLLVLKQYDEKMKAEMNALKEMTGGENEASGVPAWRKAQAEREAQSAAERAAEIQRKELRDRQRRDKRPIRVPRDPGNLSLKKGTKRQRYKSRSERLHEWWSKVHVPRPTFQFKITMTWDRAASLLSWGLRFIVFVFLPVLIVPIYVFPLLAQSTSIDTSLLYLLQIVVPIGFYLLIILYALMARRYAGDVYDESRLISHVRGAESRSRVTRAIMPHDTPANRLAYFFMWIELVQVCAFAFKDASSWPTNGILSQIYRVTLLDFTGFQNLSTTISSSASIIGLMVTWSLTWGILLIWLFVLSCSFHFGFKPGNYFGYRILTAIVRGPLVLPIMNSTFLAFVCTPISSVATSNQYVSYYANPAISAVTSQSIVGKTSTLVIGDSSSLIGTAWTCWGGESRADVLNAFIPSNVFASHISLATVAAVICFALYLPSLMVLTIRKHGFLSLMPDSVVEAWNGDDGELERIALLYNWSGRFVIVDAIVKGLLVLASVSLMHYSTTYMYLIVCSCVIVLLIITSIRFPPTTVKVANLLRMFLYVACLYAFLCAAFAYATVTDATVASIVGTDSARSLVLPSDNWWPLILLSYGWAAWAALFFLRAKITTQRLYRRVVGLED